MKKLQHITPLAAGQTRFSRTMPRSAVLLCAILLAGQSQADVIFDGSTPQLLDGSEITQYIQAEDFQFTQGAGIITDVHFWTLEDAGNVWDGLVTYNIFSDNAGAPGTLEISGIATDVVRNWTGNSTSGGLIDLDEAEWSFNLANPFIAHNYRTYWLGLGLQPSANYAGTEIYWESTSPGFGLTGRQSFQGTFDNWEDNGLQHAFNLTGTIPEPGSLALLGAGLAGMLFLRRRKAA